MKDKNNENRTRVVDVLPSAENDDSRGWSIEERSQLLLREREARLEAEVMQDANLALTQDLSLERILETLLDYLRKLVPFDSANVMLVEGDSHFVTSAIKGYEDFLKDMSLAKANIFSPKTNRLFSQICETKQSLLVSDTKDEPRWQSVPGSEHIRNWIGVPLFAHDEIIGLYSLDKAQPGYFTAEHVRIAESLAMPAANAILNAKLFRQVERHSNELEQRVAESKKAEVEIRKQKEILQKIFDHIPLMINFTSEEGRVEIVNREWERTLGWSLEEIKKQDVDVFAECYPDPAYRQEVVNFMSAAKGRWADFKTKTRDGRTIDTSWFRVKLSDGRSIGIGKDITADKRAEEALRKAEQRYRDILDNVEEGIFRTSPEGRFILVNRGLAQMLGFDSPQELISERTDIEHQHYVYPEQRREFKDLLSRTDMVSGFELEAYRKDGSKIWLSENVRAVRGDRGDVLYYEGTTQNINERKRHEEALRASEQELRLFNLATNDMFWNWNFATDTIVRSVGFERVFGYSEVEINPSISWWEERLHPDDNERVLTQFRTALQRGDKTCSYEYRFRRHNGSYATISDRAYIVRDESGNAIRAMGAMTDITERKRAEEALRESEERFRQLSEAPFEAIILHDNGTILEVNQSFCRQYGYERAEVIGKSVLDLAPPEFRELLLQRVRSGDTDSYEGPALRKDGTTFRAEVAGKPIHYQSRVVRVGAIRDITEQKRNERRQAAQYAVTQVLAESATLAEATPQLLRVICESLRWKMGECWRVCDSTNLLRCVETWHVPGLDATAFIEASRQTELAPGVGLPGRVWQSGEPAWMPDVMTDPGFARAALIGNLGLRGAVAFPILLGNHTQGLMLFFSRRAPEVDEDLLKMMSAIGSQIGQFTERKRAEEALLASERKYRDIFTLAPVGIYQSLRNGTLITANKALAEMLGYASLDELLRVKLGSGMYLSEDKRERLIREYEGLGYAVDLDMQWKRKDGSPICVQLSAHAIKGPNGETEYFEGFVRDITERKLSEEALRESEERYRDLVENSREFICTHDLDGLILSANRAASEVLGYDLKDWCGKKNYRDLLVPEVRDQFDDYLARLRRDGVASGLTLVQTSSGERRVLEYHNTLRTEGVATPIVRGMARDITEQRRAEKAMSGLRHELELTMTSMEEGVHRVDMQRNIAFENPAAARMLGWEVAELLGKPAHLTMHHTREDGTPYPKEECPIYATLRDGLTRQVADEVFWRRDGTSFPVEYMTAPMRNDRNEIVAAVVTFRDITDRKRAQDALRIYSQRLIQAQDAERQHIARELHDEIGQVLTAVKMNLQSIQRSSRTADCLPRLDESIGIVDEALGCVRELSIELHPSLLDDLGLTAALRWYVDRYAERTGIMAEVLNSLKEDERLPRELETACFRIAQEALTNVARHAQAGSVSVHLERSRERMLLTVIDDGVGFDIDNLRKKAPAAPTLGLRGMEERALAVGGHIEIDSGSGRGTRVRTIFPLKRK